MNISLNMALSMAGAPPKTPTRTSSLASTGNGISRTASTNSNFTLYKGFTDRPLGWKNRRSSKIPTLGSTASDMSVRRWDGAARSSREWDGLRRVCPVHCLKWLNQLTQLGSRVMVRKWELPCPLIRTRTIKKRSCLQASNGRLDCNKLLPDH